MGILCIFSGHDNRVISLGAIKVFLLALESAWVTVGGRRTGMGWVCFARGEEESGRQRGGEKATVGTPADRHPRGTGMD